MGIHRFVYAFILVIAAFFHILYPHWLGWYMLLLTLLVLPFDLLVSLPGMLTRRVKLFMPRTQEQGDGLQMSISVSLKKPFPAGTMKLRLAMEKNGVRELRRVRFDGQPGCEELGGVDREHCGLLRAELRRVRVTSLLGLFSIPVPSREAADTLILPAPVKPPSAVPLPRNETLRPKPGGGFSEEHELRGYRPGDPVKNIHWKLTAKLDSLVIREPLEAPAQRRLVRTAAWHTLQERELVLGRLRWVCAHLLEQGYPHYVQIGEHGRIGEVTSFEDFTDYLYGALGGVWPKAAPTMPARFTWVFRVDAKGAAQ